VAIAISVGVLASTLVFAASGVLGLVPNDGLEVEVAGAPVWVSDGPEADCEAPWPSPDPRNPSSVLTAPAMSGRSGANRMTFLSRL
jgi:hypothetical protein